MASQSSAERQAEAGEKFSDKAKILLDLFGPSGIERMAKAGLDPKLTHALRAAVKEAGPKNFSGEDKTALLAKFRDLGMLGAENAPAKPQAPPHRVAPKAQGTTTARTALNATLSSIIAENLDEGNLGGEHPSVIAFILKGQPRSVQKHVLLALEGSVARATMHYLKS